MNSSSEREKRKKERKKERSCGELSNRLEGSALLQCTVLCCTLGTEDKKYMFFSKQPRQKKRNSFGGDTFSIGNSKHGMIIFNRFRDLDLH